LKSFEESEMKLENDPLYEGLSALDHSDLVRLVGQDFVWKVGNYCTRADMVAELIRIRSGRVYVR